MQVPAAALANADQTGMSPHQAMLVSVTVMGTQAAWVVPGASLNRWCSAEAVSDANRHQTCARLADLLTSRPDSLVELSIGISVGRRVGWPPEKVDRLKSKGRALYTWMTRQSVGGGEGAFSCAAVERRRRFSAAAAVQGETAALIDEIKASGASLDELIDQQVRSDEAIARKIELDLAATRPER
jgi:hypothetical protein